MDPNAPLTKSHSQSSRTEGRKDLSVGKYIKLNTDSLDSKRSTNDDDTPPKGKSTLKHTILSDLQNDFKIINRETDVNTNDFQNKFVREITVETVGAKKAIDEQASDNSLNSRGSNKFPKATPTGEQNPDLKNQIDEDINYTFTEDKNKFIGDFMADGYKIMRGYLQGNGKQLRLYYTKLEPLGTKLASLCIVHGFGEHSGRFLDMAESFVKQGFVVHLIDLRGFGHSGGPRANGTIAELHADVDILLKQAHRDLPLFVYGHSMGGALVASLLMRNPYLNIAGVVLTSTMFGLPKERRPSPAKYFVLKLLADEMEEVLVNSLVNTTSLTKSNVQLKKMYDDRLCVPFLSLKMAKNLLEMVDYILPNAYKFKYPCLVIHGYDDTVTNCDDSVRFYHRISSEDKLLKIFADGYHELHNDKDKEKLKALIAEWMLKRVNPSTKKIGSIATLKLGLKLNKYLKIKIIISIILTILYFVFLKKLRSSKLYNTKTKLFFFPVYYLYNLLFKVKG